MEHSLQVYHQTKMVFFSDRHWLHPLMELEEYLKTGQYNPQELLIHDKIIGRAAALLLVRLKVGEIKAEKLSVAGQAVLEHFGVPYTYKELLNQVACKTEKLLINEMDPEIAHRLIQDRINNNDATAEKQF